MLLRSTVMLLCAASSHAFICGTPLSLQASAASSSSSSSSSSSRVLAPKMESLAQKMFGDVFGGLKAAADAVSSTVSSPSEEDEVASPGPAKADAVASDLDVRAQSGEVTFDDFLTMSSAFASMGGKSIPGMPTLTDAQLAETRQKFERHEKIVEVMLEDERANPELLLEDLKSGGATPGPRIQRLAIASNEAETEVGLFLMQFEAMRESTRRIAEGEDPDAVNESMAAPPGANRQARRNAKKNAKKVAKKTKM